MGIHKEISRRDFVISTAVVSGGLAISVSWGGAFAASGSTTPWATPTPPDVGEFTPWLTIAPDDTVTVRVNSPDLGNGIVTQFAMTVTEELECDWDKVRVEYASATRDYLEGGVYSKGGGLSYFSGRSTSPSKMETMLQVGASARERLKAAAAEQWSVPASEIEAKKSVLTHKPSGRTLRYGEVAVKAAAIKLEVEPKPKPQSEWTFLGKASPAKLQIPMITNGSLVYGIDVRQPDMLYAAILQSPVHGGKLKSYDFDKIKNMPGVRGVSVVDPSEPRKMADDKVKSPFPLGLSAPQSAIAVVADHYWQAKVALDALPVEWDDGPGGKWKTTEQLNKAAYDTIQKPGEKAKVELTRGNTLEIIDKQAKVVEAQYLTPFNDHVTMEPLNGTARVTADRVDVWHPSQHSQQGFYIAAEETGMPLEKVFFHQTWVGTGFGRRVYGDDVRMVVAVAKKFPGRPVQVIWSREESIRQGRFRALMATKLKAGLDKDGMPVAFTSYSSGAKGFSVRGIPDGPYAVSIVPNVHITSEPLDTHFLTGPYRGPGYNSSAFFLETFIDECAAAAGIDPLEYRLRLFAKWPDTGWTKCLKEVATKANWGKSLPKGRAQGIAISNWGMGGKPEAGTTVACVAEVEVSKKGDLRIVALDVSFDTGRIVNEDAIRAQVEGGAIWGVNMTVNEGLRIKDGRIVEGNYDQYPMVRMADLPKTIGVHFGGLSGHDRMGEIGEPPVGPIGPAIGNAIFRATGKRLRTTPFREHDLSWA